jgi:hypothetical protein
MGRANRRGGESVNIEKLDRVVVYVENLDESKQLFSKLLGITFDEIPFAEVDPQKIEPGPKAIEQASEQDGRGPRPSSRPPSRTERLRCSGSSGSRSAARGWS